MSKIAAVFIFLFCVVSVFAANFELQTIAVKFRKSFSETHDIKALHLNQEDEKFYKVLKNLFGSQETEALRRSLVDDSQQHSENIAKLSGRVKKIDEQLSVISKLLKSGSNENEVNKHSKVIYALLDEIVDFLGQIQLYPITFNGVFFQQNVQFYSNLKVLGEQLHEITGNSSLGKSFLNTFKVNGDHKLFELRDQLIANERSKRSVKKVAKVVGYWSCKLLDVATSYARFEKYIAAWIYKYVPEEHKSEMLDTLIQKGVLAVTNMARVLCGQQTVEGYMALAFIEGFENNNATIVHSKTIFTIYNDLFPKREVDFEFFKSFIHWYRMSLNKAFVAIENDVHKIASQMEQDIHKVTVEMSQKANEVLAVYSDHLEMDNFLKQSIQLRAIDLKNTLHF